MKKSLWISLVLILVIGAGMAVVLGASREIAMTSLPKEVPIVKGKVVSTRAFRSDDLTRGIEIVIETDLSLKEVAEYYSEEFSKRDFRVLNIPAFVGNSGNIENSTEADAIAETGSQQQIVVLLRSEQNITRVTIQIKGNSVFSLPK